MAGACLNAIDTKSQICSLEWSKNGRVRSHCSSFRKCDLADHCCRLQELVSAHGFSDNQLTVWRYPSMQSIATLTGPYFESTYESTC